MRVDQLEVRNFHGFKSGQWSFPERFTVLVGDNATGKTGVLDALAVALGAFFLGFSGVSPRSIERREVHRVTRSVGGQPGLYTLYPASVKCEGEVVDERLYWIRLLEGEGGKTKTRGAGDRLKQIGGQLEAALQAGEPCDLPVLAYYGTQRLWLMKREKSEEEERGIGNRLDGYRDCLDPASNHKHLTRWMRRQTLAELQRGEAISQLRAVEQAVLRCVGGATRFYFDVAHEELRLVLEGGEMLSFDVLSDGFRNMVALVADIAWRAAVLNPHRGAEAAESRGVVLIDELDLHLHPRWQRTVVDDLKNAFPNVQFVATTHSPFVVQSLRAGELLNLEPELQGAPYVGRSPEDITEEVMGVDLPQRSARHQAMFEAAEAYYLTLQKLPAASEEEVERLKRRLDDLSAPFSDDPAYQAVLKLERLAAEAGG